MPLDVKLRLKPAGECHRPQTTRKAFAGSGGESDLSAAAGEPDG